MRHHLLVHMQELTHQDQNVHVALIKNKPEFTPDSVQVMHVLL